jgi:dihydrofolate synthase/folylpolyglutamate synthase
LATLQLPARVELLSQRPAVIVDGAHNVASVEALMSTLKESFDVAGRRTLIFATTRDKDVRGMLERLVPHFDRIVLTRYQSNPRGVPTEELAALAKGLGARDYREVATPERAWDEVSSGLGGDDLVCVCGSFFVAAEMRRTIVLTGRNE